MLDITLDTMRPLTVRLGASVVFKTTVFQCWSSRPQELDSPDESVDLDNGDDILAATMSASERSKIRSRLLHEVVRCTLPEARNILLVSFQAIISHDFPLEWPSLVSELQAQAGGLCTADDVDPVAQLGALCLIHIVAKHFQFGPKAEHLQKRLSPADSARVVDAFDEVAERLVLPLRAQVLQPHLEQLRSQIRASQSRGSPVDSCLDASLLRRMQVTTKCIQRLLRSELSGCFVPAVPALMETVLGILELARTIQGAVHYPYVIEDADEVDELDGRLWRLQKRCFQLLESFQEQHRSHFEPFVTRLRQLLVGLATLPRECLMDRVRARVLSCLATEVSLSEETVAMPTLVRNCLLPVLSLDPAGEEESLWLDDDEEWIRSHIDLSVAPAVGSSGVARPRLVGHYPPETTARGAAFLLLGRIGEGELAIVWKTLQENLQTFRSALRTPQDARQFYGVLFALCAVTPSALEGRRRGGDEHDASDQSALDCWVSAIKPLLAAGFWHSEEVVSSSGGPFANDLPMHLRGALAAAAAAWLSRLAPVLPEQAAEVALHCSLESLEMCSAASNEDHMKPLWAALSVAVRSLLEHRMTDEQLRDMLPSLLEKMGISAEGGDASGTTSEWSLSLLSFLIQRADSSILPFAARLAQLLSLRCQEEEREGWDVAESEATGPLVTLVDVVLDCSQRDATLRGPAVDALHGMVSKITLLVRVLWEVDHVGAGATSHRAPNYVPDAICLLRQLLEMEKSSREHEVPLVAGADLLPLVRTLCWHLPQWWHSVAESLEARDVAIRAAALAWRIDPALTCGTMLPRLLETAMYIIACTPEEQVAGGCRLALAAFTAAAPGTVREWVIDPADLVIHFPVGANRSRSHTSLASAVGCACANHLRNERDSSARFAVAQVLAHAIVIDVVAVMTALANAGTLSGTLRALASVCGRARNEVDGGLSHVQLVIAGMELADSVSRGEIPALDTGVGRRLVSDVLQSALDLAVFIYSESSDDGAACGGGPDPDAAACHPTWGAFQVAREGLPEGYPGKRELLERVGQWWAATGSNDQSLLKRNRAKELRTWLATVAGE